jgi:hypothetical protein
MTSIATTTTRLALVIALCLSASCYKDPDVNKIACRAPEYQCPGGYTCKKVGVDVGRCCKPGDVNCGVAALDGATSDALAEVGQPLGSETGAPIDSQRDSQQIDNASLGGAGGAAGGTSGGSGGSVTSDGSSGTGGTSTVDAPLDVPLPGTGGTGGAGGGDTKLDVPVGTDGTTTLTTGAKCTDDSQCTLGFCVDGVCCNSRCGGECQACAETGSVGTCTTVQSGDPRGTRTPCTGTGKCKGQCDGSSATACKMPGNTTVCQVETCSLGQHTPESVCSGTGTCPSQTASACSSGSCATDGSGKCLGACTSTSCPTGQYCASAGTCAPTKGNGSGNTCSTGAECTSTRCSSVDGVCCNSDCTGQCQTCNNSTGTCTRVASGQPVGGRAACTGSTDAICGGRCDNTSDNCSYPPAGTSCLAATCTNSSTHQFAKTCPGSGGACASPTPASETCSYGCTNGACATCTPNCTGKCSGPDGCNGTCYATCPTGQTCGAVTANVCGCAPSCTNKCGGASDGCNGTCTGQCSGNSICQSGACQSCGSLTACNGSCVNLQSDPNNCGACTITCGSWLGCSAGQCSCTASTPNGTMCIRPGQVRGTCWSGACVLPAYFSGCNTAADCVPGGCTGPGGYCLGTIDVAGEVSCTASTGSYVVCSTSQGCSPGPFTGQVQCGNGSGGTGNATCDGPSDCPAGSDCCNYPNSGNNAHCAAQTQPGVIGSGCPSVGPGAQLSNLCDPLNPTTTCPAGKSCVASGGAQVSFDCQ